MKKILIAMLMSCLVALLSFPGPAIADHIDQFLADLNRNHQKIGNLIPNHLTLKIPPRSPKDCGNVGLTDQTLFKDRYGNYGEYGCVYQLMKFFDDYRYRSDEPNVYLENKILVKSENQVVDVQRNYKGRYHGRYFTRQYPEFAIIGSSEIPRPFILRFFTETNPKMHVNRGRLRQNTVQVGPTAVVWAEIDNDYPGNPSMYQLLIAENTSASNLSLRPQERRELGALELSVGDVGGFRSYGSGRYSSFSNFYFMIFGAPPGAVTPTTIKGIVQAVTTGQLPNGAPQPNPSTFVNGKVQLPALQISQTTNLPISLATFFTDKENDPLKFAIDTTNNPLFLQLPPGVGFDPANGTLFADPFPSPSAKTPPSWILDIKVSDLDPANRSRALHTNAYQLEINSIS